MALTPIEHIEWRIEPASTGDEHPTIGGPRVAIYLDGQPFISMVEFFESRHHYSPGGAYDYCPVVATLRSSNHFLGTPSRPSFHYEDRVTLLVCDCHEPCCWPFLAKITVTPDTVLWSDFEQRHRRPGSRNGHWDYSDFGPFAFNRHQYESALNAARDQS